MAGTLQQIHVGDIGTSFRFTIKDGTFTVDVSSATTQEVCFRKPDGTVLTRATTFFTDGTDGIIEYKTVSGDLDQSGPWTVQGHVVLSAGEWRTNFSNFTVGANICTT